MKTPNTLYSRLALATSVTLVVGYFVVYAAWTSISDVTGWQTLTATLINNILGNLTDLNTRVSNFGFSAGKVWIGTASPGVFLDGTSGLEIYSAISPGLSIWNTNKGYLLYVAGGDSDKLKIWDSTLNVDRLTIDTTGKVWIGTPTPSDTLTVNGGVTANTFTSPVGWSAVTVNGAGWTANQVSCRRIGSFLQIKWGYFSLNACNAVPAWGATVATLPVECRPVSDINYPVWSCWSNLLTSSACFTQINANGTILIYNSNSTCNLSITGTYPAN